MRAVDTESTLFCLIVNIGFVVFAGIYANPTSVVPYIYQAFLLFLSNWLWMHSTAVLGAFFWIKSKLRRKDYDDDLSWKWSVRLAVFSVFFPPLLLGGIFWYLGGEVVHDCILSSIVVAMLQVLLALIGFLRPLATCTLQEEPLFNPPLFKREDGEKISSWEFLLPRPIINALRNAKRTLKKSKLGAGIVSVVETYFRLFGSPL
ncbi:MAG: hypothetical protein K6B46_05775 [Opitutales bacterium]|nr:hypothetical protein [Opitutales bacterium]